MKIETAHSIRVHNIFQCTNETKRNRVTSIFRHLLDKSLRSLLSIAVHSCPCLPSAVGCNPETDNLGFNYSTFTSALNLFFGCNNFFIIVVKGFLLMSLTTE